MKNFTINNNDANQTLIKFIKKMYKNTNLSIIQKWFRKGKIKVNSKRTKDPKYLLMLNDFIEVYDNENPVQRLIQQEVDFSNLKILYEDENIIVIDKDQGVEVHSPVAISLDSMVRSYLISKNDYDPELENSFVVSHVHRIDKLTKGIVIYAKNKSTLTYFVNNINNKNKIKKIYLAKTEQNNLPTGQIKGFIYYDNDNKKSFFNIKETKNFNNKTIEQFVENIDDSQNIYKIQIETGRKHQIRAFCEYYKSPVINDFKYGAKSQKDWGFGLISYEVSFNDFEEHLTYLNGITITSKLSF
ncbi:ribosomal large subunit pseudouridine synthase C [Spiroplasma litorale]|uniref:RNA pseudouridylate synthase n=1 Tax=Spiroplasma litorale TaxID=216942 RepID=A0A0K1W0E7_9MOLU|nr:RluA family pseudouridine synthase [Spiroplasma litorale]AKX33770.1 ribosomal large subunit pseudouridine synthase C [Spiroplasma litorale]